MKPRLTRLTSILTQLQSKSTITAQTIADKHNVSVRTIYRDIKTLEKSGIPIISEPGSGYSLIQGFNLPPVTLTEDEANSLITAEQLILNNKDSSFVQNYTDAITKIKAVMRENVKHKSELLSERVIFRSKRKENFTSNNLSQLQLAITNFTIASIVYIAENGNETSRTIEPFALYHTNENWILIAFCQLRNDFRAFRLDRIRRLNISSIQFEPHSISYQDYINLCIEKYKKHY